MTGWIDNDQNDAAYKKNGCRNYSKCFNPEKPEIDGCDEWWSTMLSQTERKRMFSKCINRLETQ